VPAMPICFVSRLSAVLILLTAATVAVAQVSDSSQKTEPAPLKVCSKDNPPPCANAPKPLFTPDPEYSDKARKKKCRGTVILETVVGTDGNPRDIRVTQPLGCGLSDQLSGLCRNGSFNRARATASRCRFC